MKSLIASFLIFSVMLGMLFVNSRYLEKITYELNESVKNLPGYENAETDDALRKEAFDALRTLWESNRDTVSLSVTMRVIEGIDDCLGRMYTAQIHGAAVEFDAAREHLLRIIEDLSRYDTLQLGSIL